MEYWAINENGDRVRRLREMIEPGEYRVIVLGIDGFEIYKMFTFTITEGQFPFADVSTTAWYYNSVNFAYRNKLFNGTSATTFSPLVTMSNAMVMQVLYNMSGETRQYVSENAAWYANAAAWATESGVLDQIPVFNPEHAATRECVATMMYNYATVRGLQIPHNRNGLPTDVEEMSEWAIMPISYMYIAEVVNGTGDGSFNPKGSATRAEVATMFMNFTNNIVTP